MYCSTRQCIRVIPIWSWHDMYFSSSLPILHKTYPHFGKSWTEHTLLTKLLRNGVFESFDNVQMHRTKGVEPFEELRHLLCNAVPLAHCDLNKPICIHTSASDKFWSRILMQINPHKLSNRSEQQMHQPSKFLGIRLIAMRQLCTKFEQEAFSIQKHFRTVSVC